MLLLLFFTHQNHMHVRAPFWDKTPRTDLDRTAASVGYPSWGATMGPLVENDAVSDVISNVM
jgi:hypothetical protein